MPRDPTLLDAFNATRYRVVDCDCVIRIGQPMPESLAAWLSERGQGHTVWLITADNPQAQPTNATVNAARRAVLAALLDRPWLHTRQTLHEDPRHAWPDEHGWLIAGLDAGLACALGRRFAQAAMVTLSQRQPARLVWLDDV